MKRLSKFFCLRMSLFDFIVSIICLSYLIMPFAKEINSKSTVGLISLIGRRLCKLLNLSKIFVKMTMRSLRKIK